MVTTTKSTGIDLSLLGMRESSVKAREALEMSQEELVNTMYEDALSRIKKVTKSDVSETYISFAISKFLEEYGVAAEDKAIKTQLAYRLRGSDNIVTKLGEAEGRVVPDNMKPFAYSYVSKEQKDSLGVEAYCMKNLTQEWKNYIKKRAKKAKVESKLYDLFLVCDYLVAHHADKKWKKLMGLKLSADIGQPIKCTKRALEGLKLMSVLLTGQVKRSTRGKDVICHIASSVEEFSKLNNALLSGQAADEYLKSKGSEVVVNPKAIESMVEIESEKIPKSKICQTITGLIDNSDGKGLGLIDGKKIGLKNQNNLTILEQDDNIKHKLSYDLSQQCNIANDDAAFEQIESALRYLRKKGVNANTQKYEQRIEHLQKLLSASQSESIEIRTQLMTAERELNKLKHELAIQTDFNQEYAQEARRAMNQLISVTASITEKFTQIPSKRVTADDIAEFKNGIISAAGEAQNRLRDFTYSKKVEPLRK